MRHAVTMLVPVFLFGGLTIGLSVLGEKSDVRAIVAVVVVTGTILVAIAYEWNAAKHFFLAEQAVKRLRNAITMRDSAQDDRADVKAEKDEER